MTEVVLVRHGETEWNRAKRIQGHTDSALTAEGVAQAHAMRARLAKDALAGGGFAAVYSSDLGRARQTATLIAPSGQTVMTTPALRERCFGEGEGCTYPELEERFPGAFSREKALEADYRIAGGESRRDLASRIEAELHRIAVEHADSRVLVVTHGGVLAAVWRFVHGHPPSSPHSVDIPNVGYNLIRRVDDAWQIVIWGDIEHLNNVTRAEAV